MTFEFEGLLGLGTNSLCSPSLAQAAIDNPQAAIVANAHRFYIYYSRRARSALGVDTVLTLDVCMYVCMYVRALERKRKKQIILSAYFLLSVVGALSVALGLSFCLIGLYLVRPSSSRTNLWLLLTRFVLRNDVCDFNLCACQ